MTTKLRLGPIPKIELTKLTITISSQLKLNLDQYALLHAQTWGESIDTATLIPHMLETFIQRDRAFKKKTASSPRPLAVPISNDNPSSIAEASQER